MADFDKALDYIIKAEGGYRLTDIPGDLGGQTYAGISRNWNKNWQGWTLIDSGITDENSLKPHVQDLYRTDYWNPIKGDGIHDTQVATAVISCAVLSGPRTAGRLAQTVCGIEQDGIVGGETLTAINNMETELFVVGYTLLRIARYVAICKGDPEQTKFLLGWCSRALGESK